MLRILEGLNNSPANDASRVLGIGDFAETKEVEGKAAVRILGMRAGRSGRFGLKLQRCEICLSLPM